MWSWLSSLLNFLGFLTRRSIANGLQIFIKTNTGQTVPLTLDPQWTIGVVKQSLSPTLKLSPAEIKIIFAGKELRDSVKIGDCDLGSHSVLHAVSEARTWDGEDEPEAVDAPLNASLLDLSLSEIEKNEIDEQNEHEKERKKAHFFVYCNTCQSMEPGKLRVRCSNCHQGAIVIHFDPCTWDDVLKPERIIGSCESSSECKNLTVYAEFFFKCSQHTSQGPYDSAPPLYLVKSNFDDVPCLACTDVSDPVVVFECEDRHVICIDCFKDYCMSRLNERQFVLDKDIGYTLPCPVGCQNSLIKETKHFHLMDTHNYERYHRFGAEEYVLQSGGVLCPQPRCGMGILPEEVCRRVVCQSGCGFVFCRDCLQGFHVGECLPASSEDVSEGCDQNGYSLDPSHVAQARWGAEVDPSTLTIKIITKPCPRCRTPTERSGGCMHMICSKPGCGFHWCWVCQCEWTRECMAEHWFG